MYILYIFLILLRNIGYGYLLDPPQGGSLNMHKKTNKQTLFELSLDK